MLRINGPSYRWQGESLTDDIVYIDDHHYNEYTGQFPVHSLLQTSVKAPLLVFDHLAHDDILAQYPHIHMPVYLASETQKFNSQNIDPDWQHKNHCFNFMINKPRPNRLRLLHWIDQQKLTNRTHSLPWKNSPCHSISVTNGFLPGETPLEHGVLNGPYNNAEIYQRLLQRSVFEPSCVSAITEPCYYERESMITEKTLMAIWSGTIPVWIGGWRLPDVMRDLGFDVFDDIVDHSYSTLEQADSRCTTAMTANIALFRDFDLVRDFLAANQHRLLHNLCLLQSNPFLAQVKLHVAQDPRLEKIARWWGLDLD